MTTIRRIVLDEQEAPTAVASRSPLPRTNFRGELIQNEPEILNRLLARAERAEAHAKRLTDALMDCMTDAGATAFVHPRFAPQRLRAINEIVRAAIQKTEVQQ